VVRELGSKRKILRVLLGIEVIKYWLISVNSFGNLKPNWVPMETPREDLFLKELNQITNL
jgi:hypothetical protein